ncbi:MAG: efflux RND transporter periplasmic adaptor subunit [Candidatus Eisenbacteria bacterium]
MRKLLPFICLVAAAVLIFTQPGCGRRSHSDDEDDGEAVVVPVEIETVTSGEIATYFTGTATLEAEEETDVVAKVGGVVETILVEEGDFVGAGQVLARLDDEKLAVQMEQATANLRRLEHEYNRNKELFEGKLISDQEFQGAKYEYEHQKAAYDLSKLDLEYAAIRTPISGLVAERMIKVGNMVITNQPVFRVTGWNPLLGVLYVPERQIGKLRVGQVASLRVDAIEGEEFPGRVERISPVVDPSTGTVKVTVEVRDKSKTLKPGMFARINIIHDVHRNTMLVSKDAIITEDRESSVFVVRDSTAYKQIVETGYVNSSHIEILDGLTEGDTVVTTGKGSLKDSTKVEMVSQGTGDVVAGDSSGVVAGPND